jgi:hypothetical protein
MRRKWIKLWVDDWLDGSIRKDLNASETGVWADLLAMAGHSRNPGVIQFSQGRAEMKTQLPLEEPPPPEELSSERLAKQAELDSKLPKRELRKLSPERQEAARAYKEDPDKFIKGKYGHMVRR